MARRSPMNERYQKNTAPSGKTRKSASSAKLKPREPEKKKPVRKGLASMPSTPEIKRWRKIWWALIAVALVFASTVLIPGLKGNETVVRISLAIEFAALGAAVWIDWKKIRPLRTQAIEQAKRARKDK